MTSVGASKRVYFVRHGQTAANITDIVQPPTSELDETGHKQAELMATRVGGLTVSHMIASTLTRAQQTATQIAQRNNLTFESLDLFREVVTPTSLQGYVRTNEVYLTYVQMWLEHRDDPSWRFEDEESITDVLERCKKAQEYLEAREETDILVITHGLFLRYFLGTVMLPEDATPSARRAFNKKLHLSNVGLTIFTFEEGVWQLMVWNDHAHLAE